MKHKVTGQSLHQRISCILQIALVVLALTTPLLAQESFQYVSDETGQLIKDIDSSDTIIEYVYDAVGNLLETKCSTVAGPVAIFTFTPPSPQLSPTSGRESVKNERELQQDPLRERTKKAW